MYVRALPFSTVALTRVGCNWSFQKDELNKCSKNFVFVCAYVCVYRCMWRPRDILGVICQVPCTLIFEIGLLMAWNSSLKSVRCRHLLVCLPSAGISMCHYLESSFLCSEAMNLGRQACKTVYWLNYLPSPKCSGFCWHPSFHCLTFEHLSTRSHATK